MKAIRIDTNEIDGWKTFHRVFAEVMGFPSFYGHNMNAWIDCMSDIDDPDAGMTSVHVAKEETLLLQLLNGSDLKARLPDIHQAVLEASAFVNARKLEVGAKALIAVSME